MRFMDGITARLERAKEWDQAVYNEEMFFPSHGDHVNPGVTTRVMEIDVFMNSKAALCRVSRDKKRMRNLKPAMVHVNYHPDKWERMKAIWAYFVDGRRRRLMRFPTGRARTLRTADSNSTESVFICELELFAPRVAPRHQMLHLSNRQKGPAQTRVSQLHAAHELSRRVNTTSWVTP